MNFKRKGALSKMYCELVKELGVPHLKLAKKLFKPLFEALEVEFGNPVYRCVICEKTYYYEDGTDDLVPEIRFIYSDVSGNQRKACVKYIPRNDDFRGTPSLIEGGYEKEKKIRESNDRFQMLEGVEGRLIGTLDDAIRNMLIGVTEIDDSIDIGLITVNEGSSWRRGFLGLRDEKDIIDKREGRYGLLFLSNVSMEGYALQSDIAEVAIVNDD